MNPYTILNFDLNEEVMKDRARGLSPYYTASRLHIQPSIIKGKIREELEKDFTSLFEGGLVG